MPENDHNEPIAALDSDSPSDDGQRRRLLLIVGGAAALVLVLGLGFVFLSSGNGGGGDEALVVVPNPVATGPAPSSSPAKTVPATFDDKLGRNPFKPLAAEAVVAPTPTDSPTTAPTEAPTTVPTPAPTTAPASNGYVVTVKSVGSSGAQATLVIDGATYKGVRKGDLLPKGRAVQLQVVQIFADSSGKYVVLRLGSGSPSTVKQGDTETFDFSS